MSDQSAHGRPAPAGQDVRIDPVANRLTIQVRTGAAFRLLPALLHSALESEGYVPGMEILIDCRSCEKPPRAATVRLLAAALSDSRDLRGPVAVFAPNELTFGMGRMLEILVGMQGDRNVRVFDEEPELESWLRRAAVAEE